MQGKIPLQTSDVRRLQSNRQNWKMDKFTDASALTNAKYEGKISITINEAWSTLSCIPSSWPSGSANAKCNKDTTKAPTTTITRTTITTITSVTSTSATTATETTVTATSATSTTMTSRTTTSATTTTVRVCSAGEFLEVSTNDCMACPDGTFQPLDGHSSARCQRHATRCAFNEFVSSEPTATSNLICKTSEECGDGEFESKVCAHIASHSPSPLSPLSFLLEGSLQRAVFSCVLPC